MGNIQYCGMVGMIRHCMEDSHSVALRLSNSHGVFFPIISLELADANLFLMNQNFLVHKLQDHVESGTRMHQIETN